MIKHVDRRLKRNLIIYYTIIIVVLLVNIHEVLIGSIHVVVSVLSLISGFFLGIISHRVVNISRNADERKVVGRMDRIGITIIVAYTIFAICRYLLLDYYFRSSIVVAVTLAVYC